MRTRTVAFALLLTLVLWPTFLGAQTTSGAVVGTVTDRSAGVVPGVGIQVTNVNTGVTRSTVSNEEGYYRVEFLIPGEYRVIAELPGFKKAEISGIKLQIGQAHRADVTMEVGELTQTVEVTGSAAAINTETPALGTVIDNSITESLPLNGRESIQLAALAAGAYTGGVKAGTVYSKGVSTGFNGARAGQNGYYVDGADSNDPMYNTLMTSPALDAIQEFRVETNMYSAQLGRSGGGVISVVTKSGTNHYHGSVYEYHRNKALDARPPFYTGTKEQYPMYLFNQYGGSVGGPIIKQKTFFFFTLERFYQKKAGSLLVGFAPTALERQGDLSQTINPFTNQPVELKNPFTWKDDRYVPKGTPLYETIPGNKVPATMMNPVGIKLMALIPEPNYPGEYNNLRIARAGSDKQHKYRIRIDHSLSASDSVFGTYNFGDYDTDIPSFVQYGDKVNKDHDRTLGLSYTRTFTAALVNEFKFSRTAYLLANEFKLNDKNYAAEWGFPDQIYKAKGSPRVFVGTAYTQAIYIGNEGNYGHENATLYLRDNLVWLKGKHTLALGGDFRRQAFGTQYASGGGMEYFGLNDGRTASNRDLGMAGHAWADLLMGVSSLTTSYLGDGDYLPLNRNAFSFYVQDDWKIKDRLTVNLGLRYDYEGAFSSPTGRFVTFNWDLGMWQYAKGAPSEVLDKVRSLNKFPFATDGPNRPYTPNKRSFAPRIGFAFRPFANGKTVLRAGYGIFYDSINAATSHWGVNATPFAGSTSWYAKRGPASVRDLSYMRTVDQPMKYFDDQIGNQPSVWPSAPEWPNSYIQQWNLSVGSELSSNTGIEVAYVGSRGVNLSGLGNSSLFISPEVLQRVIQSNPTFSSLNMFGKGYNSNYHSLQTTMRRQLSNGLFFMGSWTWGHTLAQASQDDEYAYATFEDRDANARSYVTRSYERADFDVRHRLSLSGGWELPLGRGKTLGSDWHPAVEAVLGGWQLTYLVQFQTGFPYTVFYDRLIRPDRICDGNLPRGERTADRWFDSGCFVYHPPVTVTDPLTGKPVEVEKQGNSATNIITGGGTNNWDLGVHKFFSVHEDIKVQFRAELFNAFNHFQPTAPNLNYFTATTGGDRLYRANPNRDIQLALKILF